MAKAATPKMSAEDWRWKVESAASTLIEAEKIKQDSKLHKAALAEVKKQQDAIGAVVRTSKTARRLGGGRKSK